MKKYNSLMIFTAILTMLAYTGCGAAPMNETAPAADAYSSAADAPAIAEKADGAEADGGYAEEFADAAADDYDDVGAVLNGIEEFAEGAEGILSDAELSIEKSIVADEELDPIPEPEPVPENNPSVGMLTAGEWKDHENWGFFSNLVNTGIITFPSFGLDPTQRIAVTVTDSAGTPLPNVEVSLNNDTETIWKSVTDKNGKAYVFDTNHTGTSITAVQGEQAQTISDIFENTVDAQGNVQTNDISCEFVLDAEQKLYHDTQIMFIVDTTGSMADEMLYLQSDFSAIAEEAGDENTVYSVNFYKDEGDEYVTNCAGFTSSVSAVKSKLNAEFASGGGDEPEAVYEILKETMFSPEWAEESVKIAFLIYDAPPHDDKEFQEIISEASAKGIHIVPVVSSNGSRETELFGRALSICTNGSYVFLTDDSGIGDSHLEPIIGDYEVESLHDIIVRIIQDYKQ